MAVSITNPAHREAAASEGEIRFDDAKIAFPSSRQSLYETTHEQYGSTNDVCREKIIVSDAKVSASYHEYTLCGRSFAIILPV